MGNGIHQGRGIHDLAGIRTGENELRLFFSGKAESIDQGWPGIIPALFESGCAVTTFTFRLCPPKSRFERDEGGL
jgi:hypothetical protein